MPLHYRSLVFAFDWLPHVHLLCLRSQVRFKVYIIFSLGNPGHAGNKGYCRFRHACILTVAGVFHHVYTHVGLQQPSTLIQRSARLWGATEADHHHHLHCRRLRSTRRSWRFPVKHPLSLTASQDGVGVCTVHTSATFTLQPGKSVLASITQVRVVYTHRVPQREVSVSIYKLYLWKLCLLTGGTAWQHSGETGIHLAPPGAPLDAVHIAGCFKFLVLEELSCVIFPPKRVLSSDWNTVGVLSFFVIWGLFSSRWKRKSV